MSFKDSVERDLKKVFLNLGEFAEKRTIRYDGEFYENIPVVLSGLKEQDRKRLSGGKIKQEGLYVEYVVLHCAVSDLGGKQPEKGVKLRLYESDGTYYKDYIVQASVLDMGMIRAELSRVTE